MGMLDGKVAIITGATSGIGARTAELFVEEGAKVVFTGRRKAEGEALAAKLGSSGRFVQADATLEDDWKRVIGETTKAFGKLDVVFNNAGGPAPTGSIASVPVEGFDQAMALLVRSVMLGMKHAAPIMMKQRSGSIINNGSIAAHLAGYSTSMIYGAAKAAVNHLTRCVAMELGEHNVRVNSVSPGAIATGILAKALGAETAKAEQLTEQDRRHLCQGPADPARRHHGRHRPVRDLARLRPLDLRQRRRHRGGRRRDRRAQVQRAPGGAQAGEGRSGNLMPRPKTPALAADCVVVDAKNRVLLVRRKYPPFKGQYALPGGFVEIGETVENACRRELLEETGVKAGKLQLLGVYSDPGRDPRGHTCTVTFLTRVRSAIAKAGDDAAAAEWIEDWSGIDLAFDHAKVLADAKRTLREK